MIGVTLRARMRTRLRGMIILLAAIVIGCSDIPEDGVVLRPPDAPQRTAVQDQAMRALIMDIAEARACDELNGRFVPLPEDRPEGPSRSDRAVIEGRLWVSECSVEREDEYLALHIAGRGWRWVDRTSEGPLGSAFTARGQLRFEANIDVDAAVDLRYDRDARRAVIALTPLDRIHARVTPIGSLPVTAEGGWSGVIGGLGALLGAPIEARTQSSVGEEATAIAQRQLRGGATLAVDLCTSQVDGALGPLGDGDAPAERPYPQGTDRWLDNARAELRADAIDLSGPFAASERPLHFEVDVESGGPADVAIVCRDEAARIASEYLSNTRPRAGERAAHGEASAHDPLTITLEPGRCDEAVLMVRPTREQQVRYRYLVRREGDTSEAWVRCGERASD